MKDIKDCLFISNLLTIGKKKKPVTKFYLKKKDAFSSVGTLGHTFPPCFNEPVYCFTKTLKRHLSIPFVNFELLLKSKCRALTYILKYTHITY